MAKRIGLFLLTNLLVILVVTIIFQVFGIGRYTTQYGIDYGQLMVFCLVWGMAGALISLAMSRWTAKMFMKVQLIDPSTPDPHARELVQTVSRLAEAANIPMPEVGIYPSNEVNAFATGPSKSRSLVAVSAGLLQRMRREEVEGVLGHEIAHIANGDMVTMTLLQGVINAFVMFLARVIAFGIDQAMRDRSNGRGGLGFMGQFAFFPDGDEAGVQSFCNSSSEDKAPGLDGGDIFDVLVLEAAAQGIYGCCKCLWGG
jgi:heat shock protein HtpX